MYNLTEVSQSEQVTDQNHEDIQLREPLDGLILDPEAAIEAAVYQILTNVGENPEREGLQRTPQRVAKMYFELLEGYSQDVHAVVNNALFDVGYDKGELVVVSDIEYSSMCEHHMLPFTGKAHVGYVPRKKVVGLSKIPRIVDMFARRFQVQERMTEEIADALEEAIDPLGVTKSWRGRQSVTRVVVVSGQHSCASLRGVKKHGVNMVTMAKRGTFRRERDLREMFYHLVGK